MSLEICQEATPRGEGWWDWSVWIDGPPEELDRVEKVVYRLHPTFPDPVKVVQDRSTAYRLDSSGWGEFTIQADIHYRDTRESRRLFHDLKLEEESRGVEEPPKRPEVFLSFSIADAKMAEALRGVLEGLDVKVKSAQETPVGGSLEKHIEKEIGTSDAVISVLSDASSSSVQFELEYATRAEVPILSVALGKNVRPLRGASGLQTGKTLRISDEGQVGTAAKQIQKIVQSFHRLAGTQEEAHPPREKRVSKRAPSRKKIPPR